jgi:TRAP-type transport system periplasmic protein
VQKIFDEVNEKYVIKYGKLRTDHSVIGLEYAVSEFGHEVIELEPAEFQRWADLINPIMDEWVKKADALAHISQVGSTESVHCLP